MSLFKDTKNRLQVTSPNGQWFEGSLVQKTTLQRVLDFSHCDINFAGVRDIEGSECRPSISTDPNTNPNCEFGPVTLWTSELSPKNLWQRFKLLECLVVF